MPEEERDTLDSVKFAPINAIFLLDCLKVIDREILNVKESKVKTALEEQAKVLREVVNNLHNQLQYNHDSHLALIEILKNLRAQIIKMREELDSITAPPLFYGYVARLWPEEKMVDIYYMANERRKVNILPSIDITKLKIGQRVILSSGNTTILSVDEEWENTGEEGKVSALLGENIVRVVMRMDEIRDVILAEPLRNQKIREGDELLIFRNFAFTKLPKSETSELLLEKVPEIDFNRIGGLKNQIDTLLEAIEYPALYPELFVLHKLRPTKGILLYGPPGCGKTLLAKAVANRLAKKVREKTGNEDISAYFINIKGPELLNKYVGETERKIREVFQRAKEKASEGSPVIIFFDEFESLFRTRGSGISSDVESTSVPQFLSMMDGVEELYNVIVIGASNRQDLVDPAILRPGRFDLKIKIDRPDELGAKEILKIYITPDLPWGTDSDGNQYVGQKEHSVIDRLRDDNHYVVDLRTPELVAEHAINTVVDYLYYSGPPLTWTDRRGNKHEYNSECIETTFADGERKKLYVKDILVSGAMIESIVSRVKKFAIKRTITTGEKGIKKVDFYTAIRDEIRESSDLPNTNNPDDWAKIIGQNSESGQRIINVRSIIGTKKMDNSRGSERIKTGQYL